MQILQRTKLEPNSQKPSAGPDMQQLRNEGPLCMDMWEKENYKRKIRNVNETENSIFGKESNKSESSIHRIERIIKIVVRNKYSTTIVKVNRMENEFIIDTGSPISKKPADNKTMKKPEIKKVKH